MSLHAVVALVAVFLQAASTGVMYFIARAPGWERVRLMAAIALTAGLYSALDVWFYLSPENLALRGILVRLNLCAAALHAAMWMRFTFADASGSIGSMPRWTKWSSAAMLALVGALTASDRVLDYGSVIRVQVPALGLDERTFAFSTLGNVAAVAVLAVLGASLAVHVRRTRRGERGARGIAIGLSLYALCIVEEALVAGGYLDFMYLASPGYVFAVIPLTIQLLVRFGDDARRLAELSAQLTSQVQERTVERDEARETLLEQQRLAALGRLAAGVGHEINNPLQYLVLQLEELRESAAATADPSFRTALDGALDGAQRIGRVVTSLRTYGVQQEGFRRVAVDTVVEAALRIAAPRIKHAATIRTELTRVPDVLGDDGQLVQMLVNPLVNAAQALEASDAARREITLQTASRNGWVELRIRDSGPGFAPEVLPRLGEPYVTTRARSGGTGLGLFVTQGLVRSHGGTLTVGNHAGGGAEVCIRLPALSAVADAPDASDALPLVASTPTSPVQVLLVDDEPLVLALTQRVFERMGHQVTTAPDAPTALQLLASRPFDVVVSDLMMPGMSGVALAERLEVLHPALRRRLIVMTGGAVTEEDDAFLQRRDVIVVNKPARLTELTDALAQALGLTRT